MCSHNLRAIQADPYLDMGLKPHLVMRTSVATVRLILAYTSIV